MGRSYATTFTFWALACCTSEAAAVESTGSMTITFAPWEMAELNCCCCLLASPSAFW